MNEAFKKDRCSVGDVIVSPAGEAVILEVGETSFLSSYFGEFDEAWAWHTYAEAKKFGWIFKGQDTCNTCGK